MANYPIVEKTIAKLVAGLPRLKHEEEALDHHEEAHPFTPQFPIVDKNTFLGLEIEVENVREAVRSPYWNTASDGSLRNNGAEFITRPIRAYRVEQALTELFSQLNPSIDFSERTSIHVHMNVRTLTPTQLKSLILLYLIFENTLFTFVGENRRENIFCIPLQEGNLKRILSNFLQTNSLIQRDWVKYTAVNILPISELGTIEFRHMHGTNDIKKIITWINLLLSIKKAALKLEQSYIINTIIQLNTTSQYRSFAEQIFGRNVYSLDNPNLDKELYSGVIFVKELLNGWLFQTSIVQQIDRKTPIGKYIYSTVDYKEAREEELSEEAQVPQPRTTVSLRGFGAIRIDWNQIPADIMNRATTEGRGLR